MSTRSFRDRYAATLGTAAGQPSEPADAPVWPLPRGARSSRNAEGECVVHDRVYGGPEIAETVEGLHACLRAISGRYVAARDMIFLDTETTGLSGGTGTHVFLVGVGRFTGEALHVRQFFMRHPGDEKALLSALAAEIGEIGALVTYNGRAFDVPLLETRYRMHGQSFVSPEQHIDLLSPARAIWKHRLPSCSLGTIERIVLGVERELDAPGWMIPQLYFDYLRSQNVTMLEPVFEHNRTDIVTLARLTALVQMYEAGIMTPANDIDRLAVALHRLRRHGEDEALEAIRQLWRLATVPADLRLRALREVSVALKRRRRHADAVDEWMAAQRDPSRPVRLYAAEELAKYLEHGARDHAQALEVARRGADGAALARDTAALAAFERRLRRLERKMQAAGQEDTHPA
ncbi:MAG TPA: ribonuclease H-like domain-containing protein [Thermomicrobiales bacterium]|nr:ribonuclease H-like domain-containing protein [Thermomicrobiales bacterium]